MRFPLAVVAVVALAAGCASPNDPAPPHAGMGPGCDYSVEVDNRRAAEAHVAFLFHGWGSVQESFEVHAAAGGTAVPDRPLGHEDGTCGQGHALEVREGDHVWVSDPEPCDAGGRFRATVTLVDGGMSVDLRCW